MLCAVQGAEPIAARMGLKLLGRHVGGHYPLVIARGLIKVGQGSRWRKRSSLAGRSTRKASPRRDGTAAAPYAGKASSFHSLPCPPAGSAPARHRLHVLRDYITRCTY